MSLFSLQILDPVQQALIVPWTTGVAHSSAWLIQLFDNQVLSQGVVITSLENGFAVAIRPGCNGIEAAIILAAALFAFPNAPWIYRLQGFIVGFITIQTLNLIRIISLFYLGQWRIEWFDWAHLYLWDVLIMLDVLVVFLIWLRFLSEKLTVKSGT